MEVRRGDGSVNAVEAAGEQGATPLLFCHGLADSRLSAHLFTHTARELGLRVVAPDRPGVGGTDPRRLRRLPAWAEAPAPLPARLRVHTASLPWFSVGRRFPRRRPARD